MYFIHLLGFFVGYFPVDLTPGSDKILGKQTIGKQESSYINRIQINL